MTKEGALWKGANLIVFTVIMTMAVLQVEKVLYWIRFLRGGRGLGFYMIFVTMLVLEVDDALEILLSIFIIIIALINICFNP